jgi:signal transduction histidine kinase
VDLLALLLPFRQACKSDSFHAVTTSSNPERVRPGASPADGGDFGLRELMAIREVAHAFHTAKRPEEFFQFALERVSPLVGAAFACVFALDDDTQAMRLVAVHNWPQRYAKFLRQMRVRVGVGPSGEAASERRAIEVPDVFADPTLADWQEIAMELGFRSFIALPLQTAESVLGTVSFYFATTNAIVAETRFLTRLVADQMAAAAEKARLIESLRQTNQALTASNDLLERQNADLLEARRAKDEFLANISHELRTPLTAVIGYISVMQDGLAGPINSEQRATLDVVRDASQELLGLIGNLLELTALKRGAIEVVTDEVDPREILRDAITGSARPRNGVRVDTTMPAEMDSMQTDRHSVTRALTALLDNAFKFTREGRVAASVNVVDDEVVFVVEDTGVGIAADQCEAMFDEFRQADNTLTREFSGAGLGLALARHHARLVGGEISLTSTLGVGSTFRLTVPLRRQGHKTE